MVIEKYFLEEKKEEKFGVLWKKKVLRRWCHEFGLSVRHLICHAWLRLSESENAVGWDFSGYSQIAGFRNLSGSNKNGAKMHLECNFSSFRIQISTWSQHEMRCWPAPDTQSDMYPKQSVLSPGQFLQVLQVYFLDMTPAITLAIVTVSICLGPKKGSIKHF